MILSIIALVAAAWLLFQILKIAVRVAWCFAKIIAYILCIISLPMLIFFVITAGGLILLLPLIILVAAFAVIKSC